MWRGSKRRDSFATKLSEAISRNIKAESMTENDKLTSDKLMSVQSIVSLIKSQYPSAVVLMHFDNRPLEHVVYGQDIIKLRWVLENQMVCNGNFGYIKLANRPLEILRRYDIDFVVVECGNGVKPYVTCYEHGVWQKSL